MERGQCPQDRQSATASATEAMPRRATRRPAGVGTKRRRAAVTMPRVPSLPQSSPGRSTWSTCIATSSSPARAGPVGEVGGVHVHLGRDAPDVEARARRTCRPRRWRCRGASKLGPDDRVARAGADDDEVVMTVAVTLRPDAARDPAAPRAAPRTPGPGGSARPSRPPTSRRTSGRRRRSARRRCRSRSHRRPRGPGAISPSQVPSAYTSRPSGHTTMATVRNRARRSSLGRQHGEQLGPVLLVGRAARRRTRRCRRPERRRAPPPRARCRRRRPAGRLRRGDGGGLQPGVADERPGVLDHLGHPVGTGQQLDVAHRGWTAARPPCPGSPWHTPG